MFAISILQSNQVHNIATSCDFVKSFLSCKQSLGGSFLLDRVSHHPMLSTFNITIAVPEGGEEPKTPASTQCGLQ